MKYTYLRLVFALVVTAAAPSATMAPRSTLDGLWQGEMERDGMAMAIRVEFRTEGDRTTVWFSSDLWGVMEWPLGDMRSAPPKIQFVLGGDDGPAAVFEGDLAGDAIRGHFAGTEGRGGFTLRRAPNVPLPYTKEEVRFRNGDVALSGALLVPRTPGPHPAMVIVHGSGPQTRWGTPFFLADRLARRGIAALVYDKRGSGASTGDWSTATYETIADDALAGIHMLQQRADIRRAQVGAYGHSEGGALVALMAARSRDVAFIISADGPTGPVYKQDLYRVRRIVESHRFGPADVNRAMAFYEMWLQVARRGEGRAQVEAESRKVRAEKWFDLVSPPPADHWAWTEYRKRADFDSLTYWTKVTVPVLLVYGERDENEPVSTSVSAVDRALESTGNGDYTELVIPRAQHNLTVHPEPVPPYGCPMHPQVSQPGPGICPICQMELEAHRSAAWWRLAPGLADLFTAWVSQRVGPGQAPPDVAR